MKRNQQNYQERMNEIETELNLTKNAEKMYFISQTRENKRSLASLEEVNSSKRYILKELQGEDEEDSVNGTSVIDKADQSRISKLSVMQKRERYNSLFSENPFSALQLQQHFQGQDQASIVGANESPTLRKSKRIVTDTKGTETPDLRQQIQTFQRAGSTRKTKREQSRC